MTNHPKAAEYSRRYRDRKRGGPPRTPSPCGTHNAYVRHRNHDEQPCGPCIEAEARYQHARYLDRKARKQGGK